MVLSRSTAALGSMLRPFFAGATMGAHPTGLHSPTLHGMGLAKAAHEEIPRARKVSASHRMRATAAAEGTHNCSSGSDRALLGARLLSVPARIR
jgi:hypothetical protein